MIPAVPELLSVAVDALGGTPREGQLAMASAVANTIDTGEHLAVQAGTGTGKSLAYLVPAIRHAVESGKTVVVSTATIALQRQLIDRDLPRLARALKGSLGREPEFAILKGRNNYLCLNKLHSGGADDPGAELFDAFELSRMGREVKRLREWSSDTETGDRDELNPGVSDRGWRQVSVGARECIGASRCTYGEDCFAETARRHAGRVDVVITNHAMLAIDALSPVNVLPDHDVVVIDEAHELVDRITSVATAEVSESAITAVSRRCAKLIDEQLVDALAESAEDLNDLLAGQEPGHWLRLPDGAQLLLEGLRDRLWQARSDIGPTPRNTEPDVAAARQAAMSATDDLHDTVVRLLGAFGSADTTARDVVWLAEDATAASVRRTIRIAPLSVGGLLRSSLFAEATVVLTSATLTVGGNFDGLAASWGLPTSARADTEAVISTPEDAAAEGNTPVPRDVTASGKAADSSRAVWHGMDAGSPFDHQRSGILYVAKHLPAPGRGISETSIDELVELIEAAGGRTLGLFSSMRAAKDAAAAVRERINTPVLCQGDDATGALIAKFAADDATCLFGTLSLWQGVDVPGPSLSLVVIDRIPFPRPDDPLLIARQKAVSDRGGNGFMAIAANHAALLLSQGAGRLLRATNDRGVVAVLDSRLATARYGSYLLASLPPFWRTTDPQLVRSALRRLTTPASQGTP